MAVMLAKNWGGSDPSGWWMSEKLDGVRAVWDGATLTTRTGQPIRAPQAFVDDLPRGVSLDGELWIGRGCFQQTVGVVRSHGRGDAWARVRYAVFDAPEAAGGFEERQQLLARLITRNAGPAFVLDQRLCLHADDLQRSLAAVVRAGGEGLMLREPGSQYERRRSSSLLKVKTFLDAEATVVGYCRGTGRNADAVGALVLAMQDGTKFRVGSGLSDRLRRHPPEIGTVITYAYQGITDAGVPRFPTFLRVA
jgi:DNA ligase-1